MKVFGLPVSLNPGLHHSLHNHLQAECIQPAMWATAYLLGKL
jgi:hypothetical protein